MAITIPTVDEFTESTVMLVMREIAEYICGNNGLVAQINNNDITGFTSSYKDNVLKIDATKGDGSKLPVCNVTIEGGGSSTGNPYPTAVSGTVGVDGNIKFTISMSSGSPLTTTINMNYFASADDFSDLQEQVTELKLSLDNTEDFMLFTSASVGSSKNYMCLCSVTGIITEETQNVKYIGNKVRVWHYLIPSNKILFPYCDDNNFTKRYYCLPNFNILDSDKEQSAEYKITKNSYLSSEGLDYLYYNYEDYQISAMNSVEFEKYLKITDVMCVNDNGATGRFNEVTSLSDNSPITDIIVHIKNGNVTKIKIKDTIYGNKSVFYFCLTQNSIVTTHDTEPIFN